MVDIENIWFSALPFLLFSLFDNLGCQVLYASKLHLNPGWTGVGKLNCDFRQAL
jgi:hypothetical protein